MLPTYRAIARRDIQWQDKVILGTEPHGCDYPPCQGRAVRMQTGTESHLASGYVNAGRLNICAIACSALCVIRQLLLIHKHCLPCRVSASAVKDT